MNVLDIRLAGDPVLRSCAEEVLEIDERLIRLSEAMFQAMVRAKGIGLAAPQIGVSKRFFVYDLGAGPEVLINPEILEASGEWVYEEGCLSVPGFSWEIIRPKQISVKAKNLDGDDVEIEADELFSRLIQHELDHLDGVLLLDRLEADVRRKALQDIREGKHNSSAHTRKTNVVAL